MNNVLREAVSLHSGIQETGAINHPDDCMKIKDGIYSLIIGLYQSSVAEDNNARTGYLYTSLVHLDRVEFELRSLDIPEEWKDLDFIFREITGLRRSIYALILSLEG